MPRSPDGRRRHLRREYSDRGLTEADLAADPMTMFAGWFDEVRAAGLYEPNAMVVSTVSADGPAVVADGPAQGLLGGRLRLLHQPGLAQGRRARRRAALCPAVPVAPARAAGPGRGGRDRAARRGGDGVLRLAAARVPPGRPRLAPVAGGGIARRARRRRTPRRRRPSRTTCRCPRSGVATGSAPRSWSSGRADPGGCTTGSSTAAAVRPRPGAPSAWPPSVPTRSLLERDSAQEAAAGYPGAWSCPAGPSSTTWPRSSASSASPPVVTSTG